MKYAKIASAIAQPTIQPRCWSIVESTGSRRSGSRAGRRSGRPERVRPRTSGPPRSRRANDQMDRATSTTKAASIATLAGTSTVPSARSGVLRSNR